MRNFKPVLSSKGLLAASVALLSGTALAETAGRVSFVLGDVVASTADGSTRLLRRGDAINGGDKISTRAGRVQIRFTDGGFVSLQPNTVFGVDEYLYTNRKPEETSLFFSLLQGGMRTITGAIGKVNKQSYKVRTPVATIGIRGTGYRARLDENGKLLVSVGSGFVNVETEHGSITAGAGQNVGVPSADATPSLTDETADVAATGTSGDQQSEEEQKQAQTEEKEQARDRTQEQNSQNSGPTSRVTATDLQSKDGYTDIVPTELIVKGLANVAFVEGDGVGVEYALTALHDAKGLAKLTSGVAPSEYVMLERGTLKNVNTGNDALARWGEFTDGLSGTNYLLTSYSNPVELGGAGTRTIPWITAAPANPDRAYYNGSASYSLSGGTARGAAHGSGSIDKFDLTYHFATNLSDVLLKVTVPDAGGTTYTAQATGVSNSAVGGGPGNEGGVTAPGGGIIAGNYGGLLLSGISTTASNGLCASTGCTTLISGFFAGDYNAQVAAAYQIKEGLNEKAYGVASLKKIAYQAPILATNQVFIGTSSNNGVFQSGVTLDLTDSGGLQSVTDSGGNALLIRGDMSMGNNYQDGDIRWGELTPITGGQGLATNQIWEPLTADVPTYLWLAGSPLTNGYTLGRATYTYQGGYVNSGYNLGGAIDQFDITYDFASNSADANLAVSINTGNSQVPIEQYQASGQGILTSLSTAGTFELNALSVSSSGGLACSGGCTADIRGFFTGNQNAQLGAAFRIENQISQDVLAYGVASLGKTDYVIPLDISNQTLLSPSMDSVANSSTLELAPDGGLLSVKNTDGTVVFNRGTLNSVGSSSGGLHWGELSLGAGEGGVAAIDQLFNASSGLPTRQWIAGIPTSAGSTGYTVGQATYSKQGGMVNGTAFNLGGSLDKFDLTYYFSDARADVDLQATVNTATAPVTFFAKGRGLSDLGVMSSLIEINDISTTSTLCSSGCTTNIQAFFVGDQNAQIGAGFHIYNVAAPTTPLAYGVAALGKTNYSAPSPKDSTYTGSYFDPAYAFVGNTCNSVSCDIGNVAMNVGLTFNAETGALHKIDSESGSFTFNSERQFLSKSVGTNGDLDWGILYDGALPTGGVFTEYGSSPIGQQDVLPYIVGKMPVFVPVTGSATYSLVGGAAAFNTGLAMTGGASISSFDITFNFDFGTIDVLANLASEGSTYQISSNGPQGLSTIGLSVQESLSFSLGSLSVTTDNTVACGTEADECGANIKGFFAGNNADQLGVYFNVAHNTGTPVITGVAGLKTLGNTAPPALPESGNGYTVAYSRPYESNVLGGSNWVDLALEEGLNQTFDSNGLLTKSIGTAQGFVALDKGSLSGGDTGSTAIEPGMSAAPLLHWGRWYGDSNVTPTINGSPSTLNAGEYLHYVTGAITNSTVFSQGLLAGANGTTATYTYAGGTQATGTDGSVGDLSGSIAVSFLPAGASLSLNLAVDMSDANSTRFEITNATPIEVAGARFMADSQLTVTTSAGNNCSTGCMANVSGFFAGQQAQQIGLSYNIQDDTRQISGAGAFARGAID